MTTVTAPPAEAPPRRGAPEWPARLGYGTAGFALLVAGWYGAYLLGLVADGLLPRPDEVAVAAWRRLTGQGLLTDLRISVTRVVIGVALGSALAVPAGFLLAWYRPVRLMFGPLVGFFRALPPIALVPLVIVYFGIGETARISILAYAAFFVSVVVVHEGVASIEPIYIKAARSLGATEPEVFRRCVLPLVVPQFLVAVRVALGVSWATLVAAELVAAHRGLGAVIQNAGDFMRVPDVYVGIVLIGAVALVMDQLLKAAMGRATRWQERTGG
ncbi:ABC transporter permease [Actinomadura macrotermitis]|uniref:Putative aliphatic sulfonates transport permease protein SsuC n=1 Tax=Actinomadura macrotermitis TaxID=2585200 RepID=A0A7K0BNB3_9ACTN|nr:ABC transporter permease [Actinomadura macrotermitis]MQY02679.1 putative aliphatic sulfonates transport permease protein SsuC [Actinomadura macrotermitis]